MLAVTFGGIRNDCSWPMALALTDAGSHTRAPSYPSARTTAQPGDRPEEEALGAERASNRLAAKDTATRCAPSSATPSRASREQDSRRIVGPTKHQHAESGGSGRCSVTIPGTYKVGLNVLLTAGRTGEQRQLQRVFLTLPAVALVIYGMSAWIAYLNAAAFSEDRIFHTLALLYGEHHKSEPLWGLLAPAIGALFPEYPFEAASTITLALLAVGLRLHDYRRGQWLVYLLLVFSPGVAYLLTNALRQGMAFGVFLVLLAFFRRNAAHPGASSYRLWAVLLWALPASLIHNAVAVAATYLLVSLWLVAHVNRGRSSQMWQIAIALLSIAFAAVGRVGGTAAVVLALQLGMLVGSFLVPKLRDRSVPLLALYLSAVIAGFCLTSTGLRVVIMISLLAPVVMPQRGKYLAIAGCVFVPLFQYGGFAIENIDEGSK